MPYSVLRFDDPNRISMPNGEIAPHEFVGNLHALEDFYEKFDPDVKYVMARIEKGWFAIYPDDEANKPAYIMQGCPF